jgi:hypothetical protein
VFTPVKLIWQNPMQVRSRDVALIAAPVVGLLTAALLPKFFLTLRLQQVSVAAVAVLLGERPTISQWL